MLMYDARVNFNLGFAVNTPPNVPFELWSMLLAVVVESVGNVAAMSVQKRQGVVHVSMLSGKRWLETVLFLMSISLSVAVGVMYAFSLRNVGWFCPDEGGEICTCSFVKRSEMLSAFCCLPGE